MHSLNWLQVNGKINFKTNSRNMNASGTSRIRQFKICMIRSGSPAIPPLLKNIHSIKREETRRASFLVPSEAVNLVVKLSSYFPSSPWTCWCWFILIIENRCVFTRQIPICKNECAVRNSDKSVMNYNLLSAHVVSSQNSVRDTNIKIYKHNIEWSLQRVYMLTL